MPKGRTGYKRGKNVHTRSALQSTKSLQAIRNELADIPFSDPRWNELAMVAVGLAVERDGIATRMKHSGDTRRGMLARAAMKAERTYVEPDIQYPQITEYEIPDFTADASWQDLANPIRSFAEA